MAQPDVTPDAVRHFLTSAETHRGTHNKSEQDLQVANATVTALLLIAKELDQIGDCLAVMAGLKNARDVDLT